eukprot:4934727-Lingulodinium_polyedra.AAC.1
MSLVRPQPSNAGLTMATKASNPSGAAGSGKERTNCTNSLNQVVKNGALLDQIEQEQAPPA